MVMRLPLPEACCIELVQKIVEERHNGVNSEYFKQIRDEWANRVQFYLEHQGSPEHVPRWADLEPKRHTSFLNLYLAADEDSAQGKILALLRDHKLNLCPACGEMGRPNTLDHYLPKGLYPHFCVTPANLFPMCDACQKEKLAKTGSPAEPRFFLHPYFDVFIAEQVLSVNIEPPFFAPTFRMNVASHLDSVQRAVVVSHIRELAIEQRFAHFFKEENLRTLRLVNSLRNSGLPVEETLRSFEQSRRKPTLNAWEHIYYNAVIENPAMLNYLTNDLLPNFL